LRAYDHKVIDNCTKQIIETINRYGAEVLGPIPLPIEIHKYTVNRSTFVHKDAREQFEIRVHKRLLDIMNPTPKIIDSLRQFDFAGGRGRLKSKCSRRANRLPSPNQEI